VPPRHVAARRCRRSSRSCSSRSPPRSTERRVPSAEALQAPLAMPHVVLSSDVAITAVVGKPSPRSTLCVSPRTARLHRRHRPAPHVVCKVLRSPHAHARILAIDDSEARALPGVHAVIHYGNTPRVKYATGGQTWPNPALGPVSFDNKVRSWATAWRPWRCSNKYPACWKSRLVDSVGNPITADLLQFSCYI